MADEACVKINCPHCGQHLEVPFSMLSSIAKCPSCGRSFDISAALNAQRAEGASPGMASPGGASGTAFCANCGTALQAGDIFCPSCGTKQEPQKANAAPRATIARGVATDSPVRQAQVPTATVCRGDGQVSEKWAWWLAVGPFAVLFVMGMMFPDVPKAICYIVGFSINSIFICLDIRHLKQSGKNMHAVIWLGLLFVPIYLFVRAAKYSKKYGPAITWCVLNILLPIIFNAAAAV